MKNFNKILVVLLAIAFITTTFVFSASAENAFTLSSGSVLITDVENNTTVTGDNLEFNTVYKVTDKDLSDQWKYIVGVDKNSYVLELSTSTSSTNPQVWYVDDIGTNFTSIIVHQSDTYGALTEYYFIIKERNCDGSACPATDVNLDNVCDDCGMTFAMPRSFTPSDFPSGYTVPSVASDARYYLYRVQSSGSTYCVVYPSTVTPTYDTTKQNGYLSFSESYGSYRLTDNEWVLNNDDSPYSIGGTNNNSVDILYSSVPIKDENGENFFPIPLWEKVEKVTQGEIPQFNQTLGGNLTILTLCGVGCLTLLMALVLLSKTFRTFRVR